MVNQTDTDVSGLTNLTTIEYNALTILINNMNVSIYNAISMANMNVTGENTTEEMAILQNIFFLSNSSLSALNITNSYLPILYAEYQSILSKLTNETITINGTTYGFNNYSNVIFTVQNGMIECDFNVTMLPITSSNTNGTGSNLITEAQLAIWLIIDSIITIGVMEIIGRTRKPKYLTEKDNKSIQQTKITKDKSKSSKPIPFKKQTTQKEK